MKRISLLCLAATLVLAAFTPGAAPAQDAPEVQPLLLSRAELALWQAWIRGDHATCYARAQDLLTTPGALDDLTVVAALQARCADELGWHEAHARDLAAALEAQGNWAVLRWHRMTRLRKLGNLAAVKSEARQLRVLDRWWIAGPFSNERGQGFEDELEPEHDLRLDAVYTGKDGQKVTWRPVPATAPDGVIHVGAMLRPNKEAAAFLMTAVHSDREEQVELYAASDGPIRAWQPFTYSTDEFGSRIPAPSAAGPMALEDDVERPLLFDQSRDFIHLAPGWNVLLVKLGNGEEEWKVSLRLGAGPRPKLPADTAELAAVLAAAKPRARRIDLAENPDHVPPSPLQQVLSELLHPVRDRVTAFVRLTMADVLKDYESRYASAGEAERAALKTERAVLHYIAAWANRSAARVAAGREENRRRELLAQCLALEPGAARAALELAQYYTGTFTNPAQADHYAAMAARLAPRWVEARVFAARVLQMKGLNTEVERELAELRR
ncbi:MAG: hypothetical protein KJ044_14635, partial [Planctomycetes bacterium]|nr:hypothetical protein [Planctomycetota bacterium]